MTIFSSLVLAGMENNTFSPSMSPPSVCSSVPIYTTRMVLGSLEVDTLGIIGLIGISITFSLLFVSSILRKCL